VTSEQQLISGNCPCRSSRRVAQLVTFPVTDGGDATGTTDSHRWYRTLEIRNALSQEHILEAIPLKRMTHLWYCRSCIVIRIWV